MSLSKFNPAISEGDTESEFQVIGNLFVKLNKLNKAGDLMRGHAHTFDHVTLLAIGSVWMRKNGEQVRHVAPKLLVTPAEVAHEFECIDGPALLCCIHAIRDGDLENQVAVPNLTPEQALNFMVKFPLIKS